MNDEGALARRPRPEQVSRPRERSNEPRPPALVIELPLEGFARIYLHANSREDEMRLRRWLRVAIKRRQSLSAALDQYLDHLDEREAA
jgi:hypothetical protein